MSGITEKENYVSNPVFELMLPLFPFKIKRAQSLCFSTAFLKMVMKSSFSLLLIFNPQIHFLKNVNMNYYDKIKRTIKF